MRVIVDWIDAIHRAAEGTWEACFVCGEPALSGLGSGPKGLRFMGATSRTPAGHIQPCHVQHLRLYFTVLASGAWPKRVSYANTG